MSISTTVQRSKELKELVFDIIKHADAALSSARIGKLSVAGRKDLETPNFFSLSSRGAVPHLTPDVISAHTQFGGVYMALEDFIERAGNATPPIMNCPGPFPLHTFAALPPSLITLLAPRRTPAVTAAVGNSNNAISIFTSNGFQTLSNKAYINYAEKLHPDIAVALADIPHGSVPGTKRVTKMADRTQGWLTELLSGRKEGKPAIFAPILSIDFLDQSEYINELADEFADDIDGLAFYDSNLLPDIPETTALSRLPKLSLDEPSSPRHILRQISLGMDLFTIPFVGFATDAGIALDFQFPRPSQEEGIVSKGTGSAPLPLGIDMWSTSHSTSLTPLSIGCPCYACRSHHRAFIQHLLSAKEMLGWALIQIHNYTTMSTFFHSIRESIRNKTFESDCEEFARAYESELPEKSGQGPRVRGYNFKSEGPVEQKKNKAPWLPLGGDDQVAQSVVPSDELAGKLEEMGVTEQADQ
ncbi:putative Queuine tRNA-ribosyltransferase-like protein [Venustampulla echinocandica]|uniref:Queuine tRNA-ribosyltransferase accessory subunit 2 n=1 Tax=Venustampulla echinocandica TaxID=2656787 RepID=A0A370TTF4_9HELO|nr:putative Queuine tRNA-ribosyltransferase-like protein [Venustampulla echinocandica]RDL38768.1 putative Queuine tRNA-ribosyltransferase-like protein [Venustampulla echinocandica]